MNWKKTNNEEEEEGIEDQVRQIGNSEWCECSKQCKPMKTYFESLRAEKEMIDLTVTS